LHCSISNTLRPQFWLVCDLQNRNAAIGGLSMSLFTGTARNLDCHSTKPLSLVTEFISKTASLAPGTINVRLAAVRRLAYEAADTGLLSPDLAAGIRRVKGAKKLGMKLGNWLTLTEARNLWQLPNPHTLKGKRDRAMLAVLLGCGLRRSELISLTCDHIQRREDHWAIVDLVGKAAHVRRCRCPTG